MPSESPKWIALALSLVAITISGLSWWESHRGRVMNEELNRPVLALSKEIEIVAHPMTNQSVIGFTASLKNVGKTTAIINNLEWESALLKTDINCPIKDAHIIPAPQPISILPGAEVALTKSAYIRPNCENPPPPIFLEL